MQVYCIIAVNLVSLISEVSYSVLGHRLFGEVEISSACELNYILAPTDSKNRLHKMKKQM